ncbi:MAG: hypothetical protein ABII23_01370 [bacterium]
MPDEYIMPWQIWQEVVMFSGFDFNGNPQLLMLQNVLDAIDMEINVDDYYMLRQKIALIQQLIIEALNQKREKDGKES